MIVNDENTQQLIDQLTSELKPVRRLRAPPVRALLWLAVVAMLALVPVLHYSNLGVFVLRMSEPRVAIECAATLLTGISAVVAAFYLSIPGRAAGWVWLPLPPLVLWLATSGVGCLENGLSLHGPGGFIGESRGCFPFIVGTSVPLAALLFWALRRARPLALLPVAATGALGVAALAAFVLQFFHPFDVTLIDLALHLAAVATIVSLCLLWRRPLLAAHRA